MVFYGKKCTFTIIYCKFFPFSVKKVKNGAFSHVQVSDFILGRGQYSLFSRKGTSLWVGMMLLILRGAISTPE